MRAKTLFTVLLFWGFLFGTQAQDAIDVYVEATNLVNKKEFDKALQKFDDAIRLDGTNHKFYHEKAKLQFRLKRPDDAVKTMKKAIETREDHLESHEFLARYYNYAKKYEEAIIYYDNSFKYAESKEDKVKFKIKIVEILDKKLNQLEKAGNHINDLKQVAPENAKTLYYEAKYYNEIGDFQKAKEAALKATNIVTNENMAMKTAVHFELGKAYYELGNYDKMEEVFKVAGAADKYKKEIRRMTPQYFYMLALSHYKVYELKEAEALINKTLKMRPDYSRAHELQIKIANTKIETSLVIQHQKNAIEAESNLVKRAEKYAELSELELQSGRYEDAIKSANACLEVEPKNYAVTFFKGVAQYKVGKVQEAITTLTELIAYRGIDPITKAQYNFALGLFHETLAEEASDAGTKKNHIRQALERYKAADYGTFRYAAQEKIKEITAENS